MFCRNCGHRLEAGVKFCPECGQDQANLFTPEEPGANAPQQHIPQPDYVTQGLGAGFGACVLLPALLFIALVIVPIILMVACAALVPSN